MITVEFTKKFANKTKGDVGKYAPMLAKRLVAVHKVARYSKVQIPEQPKTMKVEFIKKFANKKKGDVLELTPTRAKRLVNFHKVAVFVDLAKPKAKPKAKAEVKAIPEPTKKPEVTPSE